MPMGNSEKESKACMQLTLPVTTLSAFKTFYMGNVSTASTSTEQEATAMSCLPTLAAFLLPAELCRLCGMACPGSEHMQDRP